MQTHIPCPTCQEEGKNSKITIEPELLLAGATFACPQCHSSVSLMSSSQIVYQKGLDDYFGYQQRTKGLQQRGNRPL